MTRDGEEPFTPRWLPSGRAILYVRFETDGEGFLHPDLFRWDPESGNVRRLTRFADVREADPSPAGRWAIAVRDQNGFSQLVRVELATGAVSEITRPSVAEVVAQPRVSPDGARVAFVGDRGGTWMLTVRELADGCEKASSGRRPARRSRIRRGARTVPRSSRRSDGTDSST